MKRIKYITFSVLLFFSVSLQAWQWKDAWQTADQEAAELLQTGKAAEAAKIFKNPDWNAVANYRAGHYEQAYQRFKEKNTSDSQYNAGNAAALQGQYPAALAAYDRAIRLNPNNQDAIKNRELIKKIMNKQKQAQNNKNNSANNNQKNQNQSKQNPSNDASKSTNTDPNNHDKNNKSESKQPDKNDSQNKAQSSTSADQNKSSSENKPEPNPSTGSPDNKTSDNDAKQAGTKPSDQPLKNTTEQSASSARRSFDDNKNQALRRVADEPGGLLRQKFLRDYLRRHSIETDAEQGE